MVPRVSRANKSKPSEQLPTASASSITSAASASAVPAASVEPATVSDSVDTGISASVSTARSDNDNVISQNYLFYANTTTEAFVFKNLIEVLQNSLTDVCFNFTSTAIELIAPDNEIQASIWMKLTLDSKYFDQWYCNNYLNVGVNLQHLYKMIKSIKKKDNLTIYVTKEHPNQLSIKRVAVAVAGVSRKPDISHINIQSLQLITADLPTGYSKFHEISTSDFQKAIKEMASLSSTIIIQSNSKQLTMRFKIDGLCGKVAELDQDPSEGGHEYDYDNIVYDFEKTYNSKILGQFIKLPGLNTKMRVYAEPGKNLKLEIDVGTIGMLSVYIRGVVVAAAN